MNRIEILAIVETVKLGVIAYNGDLTKKIGRPIAVFLIDAHSVAERVTHRVLRMMGEVSLYEFTQSDLEEQNHELARRSLRDIALQLSKKVRIYNNTLDPRLGCTPRMAWKRHSVTVQL